MAREVCDREVGHCGQEAQASGGWSQWGLVQGVGSIYYVLSSYDLRKITTAQSRQYNSFVLCSSLLIESQDRSALVHVFSPLFRPPSPLGQRQLVVFPSFRCVGVSAESSRSQYAGNSIWL